MEKCVSGEGSSTTHSTVVHSPFAGSLASRYYELMEQNKHVVRLAAVLALAVVALFVVSLDHFRTSDTPQQAAVLRAYGQ